MMKFHASYVSWLPISCLFVSLLLSTSSVNSSGATITARNGIVASDSGNCSRIGRDVLLEGGNAVDGAVATALCLGVVRPGSSGIGGGAFMLVRLANGEAQGFDMRGAAPMRASQDMYARNLSNQTTGPLSISVPGELAGLHKAWEQFGSLPWKRLVDPAVKLAKDPLANTLREISEHGSNALYNGPIGTKLVNDVKKAEGILTADDLKQYQVKLRTPISIDVLGYKILGMPPSTSGSATMMLILNILTQFGFPTNISRALEVHRMVEAFKHAYAVRMNLGDPDFVDVTRVLSNMLLPKFAANLMRTISPNKTFGPKYYGSKWNQIHDHGTTHICVVDKARNAVSMTTSLNSYLGSKFTSSSTGILLNNEMDDFSTPKSHSPPPAPANYIKPFKRALSSMTPTIVLKGPQLKAVLGAAGGIYIPAATTQVFLNHFAMGKDLLSSMIAPRYYHTLIPNVLYYENWADSRGLYNVPEKMVDLLRKKGHVLRPTAERTICQFVVQQLTGPNYSTLVAVSDPREDDGSPAGY